ncbi:hypothetical protein DL764_010124 [Monosporascus ibericus]|uniref:MARVEL domain-containing protein n=1 Tax=Monosporascus ibericus TaxID=155417 RepID=A0A4Q4STA1_9PEZI|nr:hypothetical protein DL764_010124 [Monosporascus ibericus]
MIRDYWQLSGPFGLAVRVGIRILQFVFAIVTIGLYAASLASWDTSSANFKRTNWIFALVPAVLSVLTCAYHVFATVTSGASAVWDFVLAVLWAALCGVSSDALVDGEDGNIVTGGMRTRLAVGAWIAGISMVFWLLSAVHRCANRCASRKSTTTKQQGDEVDLDEFPNGQRQDV